MGIFNSNDFDFFFLLEDLRPFPVCYTCVITLNYLGSHLFICCASITCFLFFLIPKECSTKHPLLIGKHDCLRIIRDLGKRPLKKAALWASNLAFWSLSAALEAALLLPSPTVSTATRSASKSNTAAGDV